jgi:hypothetical protein
MPVRSVAFVGKRNEPLFMHTAQRVEDSAARLYEESIVHSPLDIFEERRGTSAGSGTAAAASSSDLFLGHILTVSRSKVYGFCSNTNIKIVVVCDIDGPDEAAVKHLTLMAYNLYTMACKNPFQETNAPIESKGFSGAIQDLVNTINGR